MTVNPAPVTANSPPVTAKRSPVTAKTAPVAAKRAPVAAKTAPVAAERAPVTANPGPEATKRARVAANPAPVAAKPTVCELGIDLAAQAWRRSGHGDGAIEIAFAHGRWVLMRVVGDPERRVLVFDQHEWECFLEGARNGEFDDAARDPAAPGVGPGLLLDLRIVVWETSQA